MKLIFLFFALLSASFAAKVAVFYLELSNSQILWNARVAETLIEGGHDVTLITIQPMSGLKRNVQIDSRIKEFIVEAKGNITVDEMERVQSELIFNEIPVWDKRSFGMLSMMSQIMGESCEKTILNKELFKFLEKEKFDVVFSHMYDYCTIGVIHMAGIKSWIWLQAGGLLEFVGEAVGVPYFPSFMPPRAMDAGARMNFKERTKSLLGHLMIRIIYPRKIPMMETEIFRKHISPDFPDLYSEIAPTCPLVMVNSNELYEQATPTLHKVVNIGGIGMQFKDAKPLDQEFQSLVDKSKGVFIMSFGSVANATMMPSHWKTSLMEAFSRFPEYQFVMRYTSNDMDEFKPKNVKLTKWIPQADLLKHPKTLGFITHGGQNSIQETILAGKPMLAIPLFGDQFRNSRVAEQMGMGLVIGKAGMNADFIAESIRKLIEDKSYLQTAKRLSNMAAKKPIKPEELLNKWTTFLAEFKTLENLVPEGVNLNFIQYHSLDVIGFLLTVAFLVLYLLFCTLRALFRCIFCRQRNKKQKNE